MVSPPSDSEPHAAAPPRPERRRGLGGLVLAVAGCFPVFAVMASDRHWSFSVPLGVLGCLVAIWGIFDALRLFEDEAPSTSRVTLQELLPRTIEWLASIVILIALLRLAVAGVLPWPRLLGALSITGVCLWSIVALFRLLVRLGVFERDRPLQTRYGFWLVVLTTLSYLPMLGSFSLHDPWETHYGEVARELLARDDWISLWWAQDGWFFSKPVLDFWMQALSFSLLGVSYMPDQMLAAAADGRFPQPEWAARLPIFVVTLIAGYVLYKAVARIYGGLAGLCSGLVLIGMPYWFLLGHQTMTDMPYVAPLTAGMSFLLLGFHADSEAKVRSFEIDMFGRRLRLSAFHLLWACVLLLLLPQVLYLLSRNVTLYTSPFGFGLPHEDVFFSGSGGGNCGLPGNEACQRGVHANRTLQPALLAVVWAFAGYLALKLNRDERRLQRLYFQAGWLCVALSAMAKGAPGLVLPLFVVGVYVVATRRYRDLPKLELGSAFLIAACLLLPWYLQMYARHGNQFVERLLMHDMYKRAFSHVHDTNVGDDTSFRYYVWQLGYGVFPWTGLCAAGLLAWLRPRADDRDAVSDANTFFGLWFIAGFAMFTVSLTKFHHYVFPAVVPLAVLAGALIAWGLRHSRWPRRVLSPYLGCTALGAACCLVGVAALTPGSAWGITFEGNAPPPSLWRGVVASVLGVALLVFARSRFRPLPEVELPEVDRRSDDLLFGVLGLGSAVAVLLSGRDLFSTAAGDVAGQARLLHLISYNYGRLWPESLDFNAALLAFTVIFMLACLGSMVARLRSHALVLACVVGVLWTAWGVNVYQVKVSPHWGQRETILAYYRDRKSPKQPLVAYQMNWKGENFYTGNHVPAFVSSGGTFKDWVEQQRNQGVTVMYFITEHNRLSSLKSELGSVRELSVLTGKELNNKFFVARVTL